MTVGSITAIGHGISLPLLMLVFGELINIFIYQEQSSSVASCLNVSRDCDAPYAIMPNSSFQPSCVNQSSVEGLTLEQIVEGVFGSSAKCLTDGEFTDEAQLFSIYFVIIAVAVFFFAYIQISFFQTACERQVRKIRLLFYQAVLRQNIAWFDSNPSGELASRLNE